MIRRSAGALLFLPLFLLLRSALRLRRFATLAAIGALGGCATAPPPDTPVLSGRIGIQVAASAAGPARQAAAGFELRGDDAKGELEVSGPIGTTVARARWQPGRAELITPDGPVPFAGLDELAALAFGEALPLAAMFDWLRGRPWPAAAHQPVEGGFEQLGWRVDLVLFSDGQIVARRSAVPAMTLRVRLDGRDRR